MLNVLPTGQPFDFRSTLKADRSSWANWSDLYGPVSRSPPTSNLETTSTNLFQTNLDVSVPPTLHVTSTNISASASFDPSNIVLLTDGYCASTCAIFAELLKTQAHGRVRSVAIGGRPIYDQTQPQTRRPAPMQALGATKGRAFWSFESILSSVQHATRGLSTISELSEHSQLNSTMPLLSHFSDLPLRRTFRPDAAGVNGVNHIRVGDENRMPLQFVRDEADLRLFFTRDMLVSKEKVWERVAEMAFG